jgi:competence protein ComFC
MSLTRDIFELFFPNLCLNCDEQLNENEESICLHCRFELPLADFSNNKANNLEQTFYGRIPIEFATALLIYQRKGIVQHLIHQLKYKGKEEIGLFFGKWLANELLECKRCPQFDYIVPVPLHAIKLKVRGYNQVTKFGEEISTILSVPYNASILQRKLDSKTQTSKLRIERFNDLKEKFFVADTIQFKNKHILLIDDVVTTGATIEACVIKLKEIEGIKISVATIAFTE